MTELPKIEVLLVSDDEHNCLTAEMFVEGKYVATLSQDEGAKRLTIEFADAHLEEGNILRVVDLTAFERVLKLARERIVG